MSSENKRRSSILKPTRIAIDEDANTSKTPKKINFSLKNQVLEYRCDEPLQSMWNNEYEVSAKQQTNSDQGDTHLSNFTTFQQSTATGSDKENCMESCGNRTNFSGLDADLTPDSVGSMEYTHEEKSFYQRHLYKSPQRKIAKPRNSTMDISLAAVPPRNINVTMESVNLDSVKERRRSPRLMELETKRESTVKMEISHVQIGVSPARKKPRTTTYEPAYMDLSLTGTSNSMSTPQICENIKSTAKDNEFDQSVSMDLSCVMREEQEQSRNQGHTMQIVKNVVTPSNVKVNTLPLDLEIDKENISALFDAELVDKITSNFCDMSFEDSFCGKLSGRKTIHDGTMQLIKQDSPTFEQKLDELQFSAEDIIAETADRRTTYQAENIDEDSLKNPPTFPKSKRRETNCGIVDISIAPETTVGTGAALIPKKDQRKTLLEHKNISIEQLSTMPDDKFNCTSDDMNISVDSAVTASLNSKKGETNLTKSAISKHSRRTVYDSKDMDVTEYSDHPQYLIKPVAQKHGRITLHQPENIIEDTILPPSTAANSNRRESNYKIQDFSVCPTVAETHSNRNHRQSILVEQDILVQPDAIKQCDGTSDSDDMNVSGVIDEAEKKVSFMNIAKPKHVRRTVHGSKDMDIIENSCQTDTLISSNNQESIIRDTSISSAAIDVPESALKYSLLEQKNKSVKGNLIQINQKRDLGDAKMSMDTSYIDPIVEINQHKENSTNIPPLKTTRATTYRNYDMDIIESPCQAEFSNPTTSYIAPSHLVKSPIEDMELEKLTEMPMDSSEISLPELTRRQGKSCVNSILRQSIMNRTSEKLKRATRPSMGFEKTCELVQNDSQLDQVDPPSASPMQIIPPARESVDFYCNLTLGTLHQSNRDITNGSENDSGGAKNDSCMSCSMFNETSIASPTTRLSLADPMLEQYRQRLLRSEPIYVFCESCKCKNTATETKVADDVLKLFDFSAGDRLGKPAKTIAEIQEEFRNRNQAINVRKIEERGAYLPETPSLKFLYLNVKEQIKENIEQAITAQKLEHIQCPAPFPTNKNELFLIRNRFLTENLPWKVKRSCFFFEGMFHIHHSKFKSVQFVFEIVTETLQTNFQGATVFKNVTLVPNRNNAPNTTFAAVALKELLKHFTFNQSTNQPFNQLLTKCSDMSELFPFLEKMDRKFTQCLNDVRRIFSILVENETTPVVESDNFYGIKTVFNEDLQRTYKIKINLNDVDHLTLLNIEIAPYVNLSEKLVKYNLVGVPLLECILSNIEAILLRPN